MANARRLFAFLVSAVIWFGVFRHFVVEFCVTSSWVGAGEAVAGSILILAAYSVFSYRNRGGVGKAIFSLAVVYAEGHPFLKHLARSSFFYAFWLLEIARLAVYLKGDYGELASYSHFLEQGHLFGIWNAIFLGLAFLDKAAVPVTPKSQSIVDFFLSTEVVSTKASLQSQ